MFAYVRLRPVQRITPFQILVRDDPSENLRGCVALSQRLGLFIRIIKPMIVGHMFNGGMVSMIRRKNYLQMNRFTLE
jgi:hypothetical protein